MIRKFALAAAATFVMGGVAYADPIEGNWKTQAGDSAVISSCGAEICIKLTSGEYAGQTIGKMTPSGGGKYNGSITKPSNGKTYSGSATLNGNSLTMKGCVALILCESQTWTKL